MVWWVVVDGEHVQATSARTATATTATARDWNTCFLQAPHRPDVPQHGAPRREKGSAVVTHRRREHVCEHVWACLACVCCGCVCGSGVRRETHLSLRLVAVTASHMRGPGEGWGRGRVFPPSMPHSELVRSVDNALLSRKPDRLDDRDSLEDDAGSAVCQGWSGN